VLAVTAGLSLAGAVLGAIASTIALFLATVITDGVPGALQLDVLGFAAAFGAVCGAVAAPAGGWLLLRRVPLGRAMAWTVIGTVLGAVVLWVVPLGYNRIERGILGALAGFLAAAVALRWTTRHAPKAGHSIDQPKR
jgi:hypothetical protein